MTLSYNIGTFVGKSSLICCKIPFIEIVTVTLIILVGTMGLLTIINWYNLIIGIVLNALVGLISGINQTQSIDFMLNEEKADKKNREVSVVIYVFVMQFGSVMGFVSSLIIAKYLLPYKEALV